MRVVVIAVGALSAGTVALTAQTMGAGSAFMVCALLASPFVGISLAMYVTKNTQ